MAKQKNLFFPSRIASIAETKSSFFFVLQNRMETLSSMNSSSQSKSNHNSLKDIQHYSGSNCFSFLTGWMRLCLAFTGFYRVLPGFTGFYRVLLGFTGLLLVLLGFTEFYWVFLGLTGFYWVLWVFMGFTGFFRFVHISSTFGRRKRPESPPQISKMLCKMPAMLEMLEMLGCLERRRHRPPVSRIIRATRKVPQSRKLAHGKILCKMLGMLWMFGCLERVEHGPPISESSPRRTIEPFSQRLHGSKMLRDAQDAPPPQDARDARTSRPTTNRIVERIADRHQLRMRVQRNDARQDSSQDARDARDARTCWSPPSRILYLSDRGNERTNIR